MHSFLPFWAFNHAVCVFKEHAVPKNERGKILMKYQANSHLLTFQLIFNAYWMDQRRSHHFAFRKYELYQKWVKWTCSICVCFLLNSYGWKTHSIKNSYRSHLYSASIWFLQVDRRFLLLFFVSFILVRVCTDK